MKLRLLLAAFAFLALSADNARSQSSISPVPFSTDPTVTVIAPAALAGDSITLLSAQTSGQCAAHGTDVKLVNDTGDQVRASGKTALAIQKNELKVNYYICAQTRNADGAITSTTPEVAVIVGAAALAAEAPAISPAPKAGDLNVTLSTAPAKPGDTIALFSVAASDKGMCLASTTPLKLALNSSNLVRAEGTTKVLLDAALASDTYLCAKISGDPGPDLTVPEVAVGAGCNTPGTFTDCTFYYMLIGGIEQSDLSAQSSVTEGFYDLFIRRPVDSPWGSIWFRSRYLGTPSSSSTQNVVAAATNPTGTLTASNLPQSVTAVDYTVGLQFDLGRNESKSISYSPIVGFGATTPLSDTTTVSGLVVPAYGTNECNQLHLRFSNAYGYSPALPAAGPDPTTPTTMDCVVQPNPASTTAAGTKITDIAFSNQDRTSFLLKWGVGLRLIDRYRLIGASTCADSAGCSRLMADFTIGQDQAITGGYWRHLVVKADAIIPVVQTGAYFFAASANRIESNNTFSPLILTPITVTANSASSTCTPSSTTICVPSPSVFVLPYKQQNRDYYRIGIGIDVQKIFTKLFGGSSNK